jgi:hypothetical protein
MPAPLFEPALIDQLAEVLAEAALDELINEMAAVKSSVSELTEESGPHQPKEVTAP